MALWPKANLKLIRIQAINCSCTRRKRSWVVFTDLYLSPYLCVCSWNVCRSGLLSRKIQQTNPKCRCCSRYLWRSLYFLHPSFFVEWCSVFRSDVSQGPQGPDGPAGDAGPEGTKVMMLKSISACMWGLIWRPLNKSLLVLAASVPGQVW